MTACGGRVPNPPLCLRRAAGMLSLSLPGPNGSVDELKQFHQCAQYGWVEAPRPSV
jgi:hypothetical protein